MNRAIFGRKRALDADTLQLVTCVQLADQLTEIVTDAVLTIAQPNHPIDLHMIEIMHVRRWHGGFLYHHLMG
jgi:hypothetical protein